MNITIPHSVFKRILQRYKELQDIIAILGMDELSDEDKTGCFPRPPCTALSVSTLLRCNPVYRIPGAFVNIEDTIKGFNMIMDGDVDEYPESAFSMIGTIEEAIEKGKKMVSDSR